MPIRAKIANFSFSGHRFIKRIFFFLFLNRLVCGLQISVLINRKFYFYRFVCLESAQFHWPETCSFVLSLKLYLLHISKGIWNGAVIIHVHCGCSFALVGWYSLALCSACANICKTSTGFRVRRAYRTWKPWHEKLAVQPLLSQGLTQAQL